MDKTIKVTWKRSAIGRARYQLETVRGLGFKRLQETRLLPDRPEVRGMVNRVRHLLEVTEPSEGGHS
jgi:large subunit ribosomal protein L30